MKEIKFRAWDKLQKKMLSPQIFSGDIVIQLGGVVGLFNGKTYDTATDEFELMQFTGLKDKNGKDVYEGDVLKSFDEILTVFFNPYTCAFEVMYDYPSGDCETIGINEHSTIEIIGNIHENPDLLSK